MGAIGRYKKVRIVHAVRCVRKTIELLVLAERSLFKKCCSELSSLETTDSSTKLADQL